MIHDNLGQLVVTAYVPPPTPDNYKLDTGLLTSGLNSTREAINDNGRELKDLTMRVLKLEQEFAFAQWVKAIYPHLPEEYIAAMKLAERMGVGNE